MTRNILFTVSPIYRRAVERCIAELERDGCRVRYLDRPDEALDGDELLDLLRDVEVYVVGNAKVPASVIQASPSLKMIAKYGVGVDNIDLAAAAARRVTVTNAPGANAISVAEMTLGVMLALARRVKEAEKTVRDGGWRVTIGQELYARTLGIVGLGNIGKQVALRATAFGMRVVSNDIVEYSEFCRRYSVEPVHLNSLLERSDIVTMHVPLTPLTRHMISGPQLERMKQGSILVHTARGGVVDEEALFRALTGGHLASAAIDVFEKEPLGPSPLRSLGNVILTPHIAGITYEAAERIADRTLENVRAYLSGTPPPNLVISRAE